MRTSNVRQSADLLELEGDQLSGKAIRAAELSREALSLLSSDEAFSSLARARPDRLIKLPDVERLTGLRRSAIYESMQRGAFPKSVKVGARSATWSEAAGPGVDRRPTDRTAGSSGRCVSATSLSC